MVMDPLCSSKFGAAGDEGRSQRDDRGRRGSFLAVHATAAARHRPLCVGRGPPASPSGSVDQDKNLEPDARVWTL